MLAYRDDQWHHVPAGYPAEQVSLRAVSARSVRLVDEASGQVIEELDASSAPRRVHDGAVYLHQGDSYVVTQLDLASGVARLRAADVNYYTEPREVSETRILSALEERNVGTTKAYFGDVRVTERVTGYWRKRQYSEAVLAKCDLAYAPQLFETKAVWWDIPPALVGRLNAAGVDLAGALHAARTCLHWACTLVRDVRPVGHRRFVHRFPPGHQPAPDLYLRWVSRRNRHRGARVCDARLGVAVGHGNHRRVPVRVGLPVVCPVAEMWQQQRTPGQARRVAVAPGLLNDKPRRAKIG